MESKSAIWYSRGICEEIMAMFSVVLKIFVVFVFVEVNVDYFRIDKIFVKSG